MRSKMSSYNGNLIENVVRLILKNFVHGLSYFLGDTFLESDLGVLHCLFKHINFGIDDPFKLRSTPDWYGDCWCGLQTLSSKKPH